MTAARLDGARERALRGFEKAYGAAPTHLAWGPGRVNLIGEHTDYNDGFVLPMALERRAYLALTPRADGRVRLVAADLDDHGEFSLEELGPGTAARATAQGVRKRPGWLEYPRGVAWALQQSPSMSSGLQGFDGVLASDVPRGAGLSSSAAVELAVAAALLRPGPDESGWDPRAVALAAQRAENEWVGVASGIMDQLVGAAGVEGHAVLIDCRDLSLTPVPVPGSARVVVLDTGTRRGLAGSSYNDRRTACERVASALGVPALRDANAGDLAGLVGKLDEVDLRRARHVVEENDRTVAAGAALRAGDLEAVGLLMSESHASLRDLYEVSSPAQDAMVEAAGAAPGCLGARMTGAGFGGCAVALVREDGIDAFTSAVERDYVKTTGLTPTLYPAMPGAGAGITDLGEEPRR